MFLYKFQKSIYILLTDIKQDNGAILKNYHVTAVTSTQGSTQTLKQRTVLINWVNFITKQEHIQNLAVKMQKTITFTSHRPRRKTYIDLRKIAKLKNDIIGHSRCWWDKVGFVLLHYASQIHTTPEQKNHQKFSYANVCAYCGGRVSLQT